MPTIKQERIELEKLLNGISPIEQPAKPAAGQSTLSTAPASPNPASVVDNSGSEIGVQKRFNYDPVAVRKGLRKNARKTVLNIVKHILTDDLIEDEYVQDKMEQDIEVLTDLQMQLYNNNLMQQQLISSVDDGNTMPRNFEVFGQLTDKISALSKQILQTEQTIRKTYLDLKYEIRDKQEEELALTGNTTPRLAGPKTESDGVLVTNAMDLIERGKRRHREALENAQETTYVEEND